MDERAAFSRATVWISGVAGVVLLVLAGVVLFVAMPSDPDQLTRIDLPGACWDAWTGLAQGFTFIVTLGGLAIAITCAGRAIQSGSWASATVPLAGVCLTVLGGAALYLEGQAWAQWMCQD